MQVANPIYTPQTTEEDDDDGDPSQQPLDQPYDFDPEKVGIKEKSFLNHKGLTLLMLRMDLFTSLIK